MSTEEPAVFRRQESHIHPVILCGASVSGGSCGWSDQSRHFAKADRGRTAFQEALLWNSADAGLAAPVIVVDRRYGLLVAEQLADIGIAASRVIQEPSARSPGTVVGLTMAALWLRSRDPKGLMLVQPVDHAGHTPGQFHEAFALSLFSAHSGSIVSFVADNRQRGGSNIFLMGTTRYLDAIREMCPDLPNACERAFEADADGPELVQLDPALPREPTVSVEKALEGKVDIAFRVPGGDPRGGHDRRAGQSLAPSLTGEKNVRHNLP